MLMRFDPFWEFDRMTQQLWNGSRVPTMPMDAYRHGDEFVIQFDLPGVDPGSIDLTIEQNVLEVRAKRDWQLPDAEQVVANERPQGTFGRQLFLGENLDGDQVAARYDQGVLTVTIPIAEAAKPRKVEIAAGGDGPAGAITAETVDVA